MSASQTQTQDAQTAPDREAGEGANELFSAFTRRRENRSLRFGILGALAAIAVSIPVLYLIRPSPNSYQVATPRGIRVVSLGMSESQVSQELGGPIAAFRNGNAECFRYGRPTFKSPFAIHTACFEGGELREFTTKRFTADQVELPPAEERAPGELPVPEVVPPASE